LYFGIGLPPRGAPAQREPASCFTFLAPTWISIAAFADPLKIPASMLDASREIQPASPCGTTALSQVRGKKNMAQKLAPAHQY
jgi:hypothetical protein